MLSFDPKIITFYSYKGGVGRSMALANVAWLLAKKYNKKVLVVDWDLEAPGIHKYFDIKDNISQGLIDIFYKFKDLAKTEECTFEGQFLDINNYIISVKEDFGKGSLSILPAGRTSNKYGNQVVEFDWHDFYKRFHGYGFIEYLKEQFKQKADFILVDSRTGLSDIGGICTLQLPDIVVLMFAFNEQNILGTEMVINSILKKSIDVKRNKSPPELLIIPSRVEKFVEIKRKKKWEIIAIEKFHKHIPNRFLSKNFDENPLSSYLILNSLPESEISLNISSEQRIPDSSNKESSTKDENRESYYGQEDTYELSKNSELDDVDFRLLLDYMRNISIPYVGYYSFGEELSIKSDISEEPNKSYNNLTEMILETCLNKFNEELDYLKTHKLLKNKDKNVRRKAVKALGASFQNIPDKQQAMNDLHGVILDEDKDVRVEASKALGTTFQYMPDKQKAWIYLQRLISDEDKDVQENAAKALGTAFQYIPDKQQAWNDLHRLTNDKNKRVRAYAYHFLGKVSIFKASQAGKEEDYKAELEKAIEFFKRAAQESPNKWFNPSKFCLPFYRSFYVLVFGQKEIKGEIDKYLAEAKAAIGDSKENEYLFKIVENLANALKEVQNLEYLDLHAKRSELDLYRQYCDHAAELMRDTEVTAPFAAGAMRKGMPILDRNLKGLLEEIQEKAKSVCKQTRGTSAKFLGVSTSKIAKGLSEISDNSALDIALNEIVEHLKIYSGFILLGKKSQFLELIEETKNMSLSKKLEEIPKINEYILENALFPRIENIRIAERVKEIVRIATVQLSYTLSESFPYRIKDEDKEEIRQKILYTLSKAKDEKVDILCLPELCIFEEWLYEMRNLCQKMIVVSGTYYDKENHNVCMLITDFDVEIPPQLKIVPSDFEYSGITGQKMISGEKVLNVYETHFGKFGVLINRDFGNFSLHLKGIVDLIFCPSYNNANERFHNIAHNHVTETPSYIIISNAALYGGTSIFGRMKKSFFGVLEQGNCKEKGDTSYKLCQIEKGKEGMIIADFNLVYKSPQLQTPMDPSEEIIPVTNIRKLIF